MYQGDINTLRQRVR